MTISLCMIVKNEEAVIGRCLDTVRDIADEILLVDTGSTDQTVDIAKKYTNSIYHFPWRDDFSAARNFAFSKAKMDYQMWLDADDVIEPGDREKFLQLKRHMPDADIIMMPYHTAFDQNGHPVFTCYRERLMRRSCGFRWVGAVHEAIVPAGKVVYSDIAVCHRKEQVNEPGRNLRILENQLQRDGTLEPRMRFYLGRELHDAGRDEEAAVQLETFLREPDAWVENRIDACLTLSACYRTLGQTERILPALLQSLEWDTPRAEICCAAGAYFYESQQLAQAIFWYDLATQCTRRDTGGFSSPDCYDYLPYMQLCVCYDRMGNIPMAEICNEKAAACKPDDPAVAYNRAYFARWHLEREATPEPSD